MPILFGQERNHHNFVSHDGINIAFTSEGSGYPVLLLHGFINSGSSWNKSALKNQLLQEGYRVIVPDLRGNGKSDRPENAEAYKNNNEVKDLLALADHLNLQQYGVVGYSRGAIVLAKLLTFDPRIDKAVLSGMGADFTDPNWKRRKAFADAFGGRVKPNDLTAGAITYAKSVGANLKVLGHLQDYQPVTSEKELKNIQIPVLIICGDKDHDNGNPEDLKKLIPNSVLKIIDGDHNNSYKQENFSLEVLEFFNLK